MPTGKPHPLGPMPQAGITILQAVPNKHSNLIRNIEYIVRYDCCGELDKLQHQTITRRRSDGNQKCHACSVFRGKRPVKGPTTEELITRPDWPVPPSRRPKWK